MKQIAHTPHRKHLLKSGFTPLPSCPDADSASPTPTGIASQDSITAAEPVLPSGQPKETQYARDAIAKGELKLGEGERGTSRFLTKRHSHFPEVDRRKG